MLQSPEQRSEEAKEQSKVISIGCLLFLCSLVLLFADHNSPATICQEEDMCRSIKQLRRPEPLPSEDEIQAAALQYIRKISGYRVPSKAKQAAFEQAVREVADTTRSLLEQISPAPAEQTLSATAGD
jgi:hypothetical protein